MSAPGGSSRSRAVSVLAFATMGMSSFALVTRVGGSIGALLYLVGLGVAWWVWPAVTAWAEARLSRKIALLLVLSYLALVAVATLVVYPHANAGTFGRGSDADDALRRATEKLLALEHPYRDKTYLGNRISPLPGGLLLAIPFVVVGRVELFGVFALGALLLARARAASDKPNSAQSALLAAVLLAFGCPAVLHALFVGSDTFADACAVSVALMAVAFALRRDSIGWLVAASALVGVATCTRANFVFVLPSVALFVWRTASFKRAAVVAGVSVLVLAALLVPLYLVDPSAFSPLHATRRLAALALLLPGGKLLGTAMMGLASLLAASMARGERQLWIAAGVSQLVPALVVALSSGIAWGLASGLNLARYGVMAVPFFVMASVMPSNEDAPTLSSARSA